MIAPAARVDSRGSVSVAGDEGDGFDRELRGKCDRGERFRAEAASLRR